MKTTHFSCGGRTFSVSAQPVAYLEISDSTSTVSPHPLTVFFIGKDEEPGPEWVEKEKCRMLETDDVFNEGFLEHVLFCGVSSENDLSAANKATPDAFTLGQQTVTSQVFSVISRCMGGESQSSGRTPQCPETQEIKSSNYRVCTKWKATTHKTPLRSGPYFLDGPMLHKIFRLYEDPNETFMFGVTDDDEIPPTFQQHASRLIPVPSRLYFGPASAERPLQGKRVAVKDVFHLKGTPTSASNRDFQNFTGIADQTASMVLRLLNAGATVVGKTKTAQFASGEHARDWVDYQCPFNPRGDGYLEPEGSSTGSAASIAAYSWLDFSIGTDTLGSILGPAASQGIFGIRPTHGISDLSGVIPVSAHLDTAGFFARSVVDFRVFGQAWYSIDQEFMKHPTRLLYATEEFDSYPKEARLEMDSFVEDIERAMNQSKTPFNVSTIWREKSPGSNGNPLSDFLHTTLAHIQLFDCYRNNLPFRETFKNIHEREPYANPMVRFKWDLGSRITAEQYASAREEQMIYRKFLREHVFDNSSIVILPGGSPKPRYRDAYDPPPSESAYSLQGFEFLRDMYSFLGGLPQVVLPVSSVTRQSPVTYGMVEEPVTISLVGAEGTDCMLMEFAENVLRKTGRPLEVRTGSTLF